jgi:tellurite resistance protein
MSETSWHVADPQTDGERLQRAVLALVEEDTERSAWLRAGAASSVADEPIDRDAAQRFQTMLELAYLVASADGFADTERASLSTLLESITGAAVDRATLELHFRDLDDAVAQLGRRERLARAAADLETPEQREDVIAMVAIVALADGQISPPEFEALVELGRHVEIPAARVRAIVDTTAARVKAGLR